MRPPFSPDAAVTAAPISLPEITDEMVERATNTYVNAWRMDEGMRAALTEFRLALFAGIPLWQPIERDQIRAGMRIRATTTYRDCVTTRTGVAHHTGDDGIWYTERDRLLTGWAAPTTYEVDSATIPDPDAELIEKIGKAIYDADGSTCEWGEDGTEDVYRKLARAALTALRAEEAEEEL